MLGKWLTENKIPKLWRHSKIIAILKPEKDSAIPKSYRYISLLCHAYKLYERIILNRVTLLLEQHLIKEQVDFRPGKSCTSQLINLTQHIKNGYQGGMITSAAFVDLSAEYDTLNHWILIKKLYNITQDSKLCRVLHNSLSNRRLYVELYNERSRWRIQKNRLPRRVSSHQSYSTSTQMISHFMTERVASYTQTIYVSQPNTHDTSYCFSFEEQIGKTITKSGME